MRARPREEITILLPGLWMPSWVMLPLAWRLGARGHRCLRFGYASFRRDLESNADRFETFVHALGGEEPIHLVGHSLGGVLALHATASRRLARVRSIVMVGSPAQESYAARALARWPGGRCMLGRTVPQWLEIEKPAAPEGVAVGVIAGTMAVGLGRIVAPRMPQPHDGVIRVAETSVAGMSACAEVRVSHAGMLVSKTVARLVDRFLRTSAFDAPASDAETAAWDDARLRNRQGRL